VPRQLLLPRLHQLVRLRSLLQMRRADISGGVS
jgi:hypothetical protein